MTDLIGKDFNTIKMFKELKKTILKEVKKAAKTISYQIENIHKLIIMFLKKEPN